MVKEIASLRFGVGMFSVRSRRCRRVVKHIYYMLGYHVK